MEGTTDLTGWQDVGGDGAARLNLSTVAALSTGDHTFTLEVKDAQGATFADSMVLTVNNSSPYAAVLQGPGTYEMGATVLLKAEVHDFDGDLVSYAWKEGAVNFASSSVQTLAEGGAVAIPECLITSLGVGVHTLTLEVSDGINAAVSVNITVTIIDSQAPVLNPSVNQSILWPPNHQMVDIVIQANALDNNGLPVNLSAAVVSNEPQEGLGDGDTAPDWTTPVVNADGTITLQLRAERSGKGTGRIYTISVTATDTSGNQHCGCQGHRAP